jgi:hypothetical protein
MEQQRIRVVVGEGRAQRQGLLTFVLEGEGMQVVATATTCAELAATLVEHRPDVVVLDDGIGSIAVSMTRKMLPTAKVVLVWPRGVVAIDGDANVEPSEVLRKLGATVDRLMDASSPAGVSGGGGSTGIAPGGRASRRDGPAGRIPSSQAPRHPSVTQLRRRGQRLHPSTGMGTIDALPRRRSPLEEPPAEHRDPAPVLVLPVRSETVGGGNPTSTALETTTTDPVIVIPETDARRERRRDAVATMAVATACLLVLAAVGWSHRSTSGTERAAAVFAPASGGAASMSPHGRGGGDRGRGRASGSTPDPRALNPATPATGAAGGTAAVDPVIPSDVPTGGSTSSVAAGGGTGGVEILPGKSAAHNPHGGPPGHAQEHPPAASTTRA